MKKIRRLILTIVVVSIVIVAANVLTEGIPLLGVPQANDVVGVRIQHSGYPEQSKEYTDQDSIELAVALCGYLRYSPLKPLSDDQSLIQITYVMKDGTECVVSANHSTVWWNGNPHALKRENTFVKLCTAIFFTEDK